MTRRTPLFITASRLRTACLLAALIAAPRPSAAQALPLRLQWEADPPRDGMQAVCGEVFNDGRVAVQHVRLLVEDLDDHGLVIGRREMEVLGEVPSDGRSYFCVPEPAGAATYRVTVIGADRMSTSGQ